VVRVKNDFTAMCISSKKVKAFVRVKPTADFPQEVIRFGADNKTIEVHIERDLSKGIVNNKLTDWSFKMDGVLHNASQDVVYDAVAKELVSQALNGYNGMDEIKFAWPLNSDSWQLVTVNTLNLKNQ
uniref:Kinesin motor domain-containing protein n=2 Tax=Naja naja TaxID=35670 RepID=A0A8C7E7D7_NAJNA